MGIEKSIEMVSFRRVWKQNVILNQREIKLDEPVSRQSLKTSEERSMGESNHSGI